VQQRRTAPATAPTTPQPNPPTAAPPPTTSALRRALHRAEEAVALDVTEATVLLAARGADLGRLAAAAGRVRDAGLAAAGRPGVVTYSRKVFLPLTRLCRDRCHYCTFATTPHRVPSPYLGIEEMLAIARKGQSLGCKEALFTLGDRPEERWPAARRWLDQAGYGSTLDYLRACAVRVLEETGLLPHLNAGVLSWEELQRLKPVAPSMGMMLETTSRRLYETPGGAHYGSPDKDPAVRLRVLADAGRSNVPFTTGILLGIGETLGERAEALFALRRIARQYSGLQEIIVQNFRAKPDTPMRSAAEPSVEEVAATVAVARLVLGPTARIQAPPNLVDEEYATLLAAGIDDWGGVSPLTPDHVNPERPWPHIEELASRSAEAGYQLRERLTIYPPYQAEPWLDPRLAGHVAALADSVTGLARDVTAVGRPWQEPDGGWASAGRIDLHRAIDRDGRREDRRGDFDAAYGSWDALRDDVASAPHRREHEPARLDADIRSALRQATTDPAGLGDCAALALFGATGAALDALCRIADDLRRDVVGDVVTFVVNRNINFTNVCYTGCRFCAFAQRRTDPDAYTLSLAQVGDRVAEAAAAGATEVCLQGGISPELPGDAYLQIAAEVKRRAPQIHLHAFSPMEVVNGATRMNLSIAEFLTAAKEAGLDSIPGTAAEILDDDVRWVLTKGKLPTASWVEVVTTAHGLGIPSTATMMYGHVDTPAHWLAHLRLLARLQQETGGFTEFVPLPFVHHNAPLYLAGLARPGPTPQENRAVHALARLLLHSAIPNLQCSWVKLGSAGCVRMLRGGVNDLGGTLMEETISRMAGSEHGSSRTPADLIAIAADAGRPARQRTTSYAPVASRASAGTARTVPG
jgi:FO synthase